MTLSGRYTERSSGVAFISFGASEKVGRVARMKGLIQVLEPVWKLSFWVGVLPDWFPLSTTEAVFHNFQSNRSVHFYLDPYGVDVISNFLPDHRFPGNYFNQINHLQSHWVLPSTDSRSLLLLHSAEEKYNFKVFQVLERTGMSPSDAKSSK